MDFELDDDQHALQEAVRDLVDKECPPSLVRAVVMGEDDGSTFWKTLVGLDWPGLTVPEADGGTGMTALELILALEELGRGADPTPFLATTSQYVPLVREARPPAAAELLGAVCAGSPGAGAFSAGEVTARREGDGWVLSGTATSVVDADRADEIAVVRPMPGSSSSPPSPATITRRTTFDASFHVADVVLDGVTVARRAGRRPTGTPSPRGRAGGHRRAGGDDGRRLPADPGARARPREGPSPVRRADRLVPGGQAPVRRRLRRHPAGPGALPVRRP